ncbi:hypothetical protein WJX74_003899 [Apatococcus lobatus]|uniref:Uncharacterized protein n=1 Tax=Apatococcus lobatus TaxID=904363 RepID=A0AAW1S2W9_9CHLO
MTKRKLLDDLCSIPVRLDPSNPDDCTCLPAFGAVSLADCKVGKRQYIKDCLYFVGGRLWAVDWLSATEKPKPEVKDAHAQRGHTEYVAVSAHSESHRENIVGSTCNGPGLLQIVALDCSSPDEQGLEALPRLSSAIRHQGALAWDVKWCLHPNPPFAVHAPRLGLLAAALGNGQLVVYDVPCPPSEHQQADVANKHAASTSRPASPTSDPCICDLQPLACSDAICSQPSGPSLPSCLDWLPTWPHDLLVVGCWDGTVIIYRLNRRGISADLLHTSSCRSLSHADAAGAASLELLQHFAASQQAQRAVSWLPAEVASANSTFDQTHRHVFAACGHSGYLQLWDARDTCRPIIQFSIGNNWLLDFAWNTRQLGLILAQDQRFIEFFHLRPEHSWASDKKTLTRLVALRPAQTFPSAIWSVHACNMCGLMAYGTSDGLTILGPLYFPYDNRARPPHHAISGLQHDGEALSLADDDSLRRNSSVYKGSRVGSKGGKGIISKQALPPNPYLAVHAVRWNPNGGSKRAWLAHGGAAGFLRLQHIAAAEGD